MCKPSGWLWLIGHKERLQHKHTCANIRYKKISFEIINHIEEFHLFPRPYWSYIGVIQATVAYVKKIAIPQKRIVRRTCESDTILSVFIVHPADRRTAGSSVKVTSRTNVCTATECVINLVRWGLFAFHMYPSVAPPEAVLIKCSSMISKLSFTSFFFGHLSIPSIAIISASSTGSTADSDASLIAKSLVLASQLALTPLIYIVTFCSI